MSRFIGKRVFYHCDNCKKRFTVSNKTVDKSEEMNLLFCSQKCWEDWQEADEKAATKNAFFGTVAMQIAERLSNSVS